MAKVLTIEIINKIFDNNYIGDAIGKIEETYFTGVKATDKDAPSREVALYFLEKLVTEHNYRNSFPGIFEWLISECGYFTLNDFLKNPALVNKFIEDMGGVNTRVSRKRTDFYPETLEGIQELYNTIKEMFPGDEYKEEALSLALLKFNLRYDMESKALIKNLTNMFEVGYELIISKLDEETYKGSRAALRGPHFPLRVFKKEFAIAPGVALNNLAHRLNSGGISIDVFCREYLPFLQEKYPGFPYLEKADPVILDVIKKSLTLLGWDKAYENNDTIYNFYIKPLMKNNNMYEFFKKVVVIPYSSETAPVESIVQIAGATLSADEFMTFYNGFIENMPTSYFKNSLFIRFLDPISRRNSLVSEEFIELQIKEDISYSLLCLNNECINDINFWIKLSKRIGDSYLFSYKFRYANSFKKNFIPNIEQEAIYSALSDSIDWDTLSCIDNMPQEFLIKFLNYIGLSNISDKAITNLSEEVIDKYINLPKGPRNSLFRRMALVTYNKNITKEFLSKHIEKFYCINQSTRTFKTASNIRLSDLVELV